MLALVAAVGGLAACSTNVAPASNLCTDTTASTYVNPGALPSTDGDLVRCAHDGTLAAADVDRLARSAGYVGATLGSGFGLVRLSYRTGRGTSPSRPGFSSAVALIPDSPRAPTLPVIVVAHGTVGEAPSCPPSRESPTDDDTYLAELAYPLVGAGYAVIVPDYAGYAGFGSAHDPPSGYHAAADEARSTLDAARALRHLQPALFSSDVVLVGHSQGGHAVLSALAMAAEHDGGGTIAGVVAYAPSWFSMRSFGAILAVPTLYPLASEADTVAASLWYHYSHAELLDGPGSGVTLFAAAKRDAIRAFFDGTCDPNEDQLASLGTTANDLYDPAFIAAVANPAALDVDCGSALCTTWMARYAADRPHLGADAAQVPLLIVYGDQDEWIPGDRETCTFDRLASDGANATVCIVAGATHDGAVGARADYVNGWIAERALGGSAVAACGPGREALLDDTGAPYSCATVPPND
jgi:dienelactone hydrolase